MDNSSPSLTALRVAKERAAHQILENPRIFEDPLALRILERMDKLKTGGLMGIIHARR